VGTVESVAERLYPPLPERRELLPPRCHDEIQLVTHAAAGLAPCFLR
jgi:hypothetical protein